MFVARIGAEAPQVQDKMKAVVKGKIAPFSALSMITDWAAVKKVNLTIRLADLCDPYFAFRKAP